MSDNVPTEKFTLKYNIMCPQVRSLLFITKATDISLKIIKSVDENQQVIDDTSTKIIKIMIPEVHLQKNENQINDVEINDFHAICTYLLNDSVANHSLYPIDALERAKIDDFMFLHAKHILGGLLKPLDGLRLDYSEIKKKKINELYIKINDELINKNWLDGEECTVADLFVMATVKTFNIFVPLDNVPELQNLKTWYDRVNKNELYTEGRKETIKSYVEQHTSDNKDFLSTNNISLDSLVKKLFIHVKYYLKPIREVGQSTDDHISGAYGKIKLILKKNGPYIFGENLTIADLFLMGTVHTLQKFVGLSGLPEFTAWYDYVLLKNPFIKQINNLYTDEFCEHYQSLMEMIKIRKEFEKFSEIFNKPPINRN